MDQFRYFRLAKELNEKYFSHLIEYPARFRGSFKSMSLISLKCYKPQIGLSEVQNDVTRQGFQLHDLLIKLDEVPVPGRPTPEKELQSWILKNAVRQGAFTFDKNITLVTDEYASGTSKIVADIIGYNQVSNAIVLIELKSERELMRLCEQLRQSANGLKDDKSTYIKFLEEYKLQWHDPYKIEKIAVWPKGSTLKKRFPDDIREFCYEKVGCDFIVEELFP